MCQITEPTEHKIKLLLDNQQGLWARVCLSSKNCYSPTDSLRHLMLLHSDFLYKILECQKDGKGEVQAYYGEHLIFSVQMQHLLWLPQDPQHTQDGPKHCNPPKSPPHNPALLILSSRLPSSWTDLCWCAESTLYCYILNLNMSAVHCVSGLSGSGTSASVRSCAFIFLYCSSHLISVPFLNMILEMAQQKSIFICTSNYWSLPASQLLGWFACSWVFGAF